MKRILCTAAILLASVSAPVLAADVGVSVTFAQPGFYGTIDIGGMPPPQVVNVQPVIVRPVEGVVEPIYMHVPPGHAKHWSRYCGRYNACGRPVYFVRDDWYRDEYVPHYRDRHGDDWRDGDRDRRYDERYRDRRYDDRGRGDDQGHGRGRGHDRD